MNDSPAADHFELRVVRLETLAEYAEKRFDRIEQALADLTSELRQMRSDIHAELLQMRTDNHNELLQMRSDSRSDLAEIRRDARSDFRLLFGAPIFATLGLAGLMARGFGWL